MLRSHQILLQHAWRQRPRPARSASIKLKRLWSRNMAARAGRHCADDAARPPPRPSRHPRQRAWPRTDRKLSRPTGAEFRRVRALDRRHHRRHRAGAGRAHQCRGRRRRRPAGDRALDRRSGGERAGAGCRRSRLLAGARLCRAPRRRDAGDARGGSACAMAASRCRPGRSGDLVSPERSRHHGAIFPAPGLRSRAPLAAHPQSLCPARGARRICG